MSKDLMFQDEIKDAVRDAYGSIESGAGDVVATRLYSEEELAELPAGAHDWALGVGNPVRYAFLQPGEVVLDVGPTGKAIGLDIVEAMLDRARANAVEAGVDDWTEFLHGEMEQIPLPDASVDVVISNGVLNLSARKSRALAEIFRVLRPGGRISLADLTVDGELPPEIANDQSAWAG
jgi:ubiquinone/menaquinone biosynthesis C-methylase UbiE